MMREYEKRLQYFNSNRNSVNAGMPVTIMMSANLTVNVFSHADCFVTFAFYFGIWNKAVFPIEFYNTFVMFDICVYSIEDSHFYFILVTKPSVLSPAW